jgi:hypothetical protein
MVKVAISSADVVGHVKVLIFQGIDRDEESHGGSYDQKFEIAERCIGRDEDERHMFLPIYRVFGMLQQWPWQEGLASLVDCFCNGAP